jgi:translation initiation factor eIF-2B subunit delta
LIQIGPSPPILSDWRDKANLKLLHLVYDLTPVEFVTMVISEVGVIPATSVPVIIREYQRGL